MGELLGILDEGREGDEEHVAVVYVVTEALADRIGWLGEDYNVVKLGTEGWKVSDGSRPGV